MSLWVLTPLPGVLKFVLLGWNVPEGRMQSPPVVDLVDEVRQLVSGNPIITQYGN
jgi:hypothetical protein